MENFTERNKLFKQEKRSKQTKFDIDLKFEIFLPKTDNQYSIKWLINLNFMNILISGLKKKPKCKIKQIGWIQTKKIRKKGEKSIVPCIHWRWFHYSQPYDMGIRPKIRFEIRCKTKQIPRRNRENQWSCCKSGKRKGYDLWFLFFFATTKEITSI